MAGKQKSLGGVNVELGTKAKMLDLTKENTTATLYKSLEQVESLRAILERGAARLARAGAVAKPGKTPKLKLNVKLGTKQHRLFAPKVVMRPMKANL